MYIEELGKLGLSKNEAEIYETLIESGELGVSDISRKALIHRRNVYDCMNRLLQKGLVIELLAGSENHYKAVGPEKLKEILAEKKSILDSILPEMSRLYRSRPHKDEVYILKGVEGWKNYMREILRLNRTVYTIGGGGLWADPKIDIFFENFIKEAKEKKIVFKVLYDYEIITERRRIKGMLGDNYKILPEKYSTKASVDVFGDHVVILTKGEGGAIDDSILTVIVNPDIASSFKIWFKLMWSVAYDPK